MKIYSFEQPRQALRLNYQVDLCVVGGGLAGVCGAITAAREGLKVFLIQDRPVLGGNSSSEVRLWALGASSHNHNNNRWAREGGVIDEILVENMYRNPEGNALIFDTILLEKVHNEANITLLLDTTVYDADIIDDAPSLVTGLPQRKVRQVSAYCSISETFYDIVANYYLDASGDGLVSYMAGLPFRFGAEDSQEFSEGFAPDPEVYGEFLGHSIFFITKDTGKPVTFIPPNYVLQDIEAKIPRFRNFSVHDQGCEFWWIEYGGRLDTIHDSQKIKWELWRIVLGVWNYMKNSGNYPEAENLTLEWFGAIPGKRESRRFVGHTILTQQDIVEQRSHKDTVSYGGWSIDLHPSDGIYSARPGCDQYHGKGVYEIPLSTMMSPYSSNIGLAGRIISTSHVAFGSSRVMCTCAHNAQGIAMAIVWAHKNKLSLDKSLGDGAIELIQRKLVRKGQHIPGFQLVESENHTSTARITTSSAFSLSKDLSPKTALQAWTERILDLTFSDIWKKDKVDASKPGKKSNLIQVPSQGNYQKKIELNDSDSTPIVDQPWVHQLLRPTAQMIPLLKGQIPDISVIAFVYEPTELVVHWSRSVKPENYTPEIHIDTQRIRLQPGASQELTLSTTIEMLNDGYMYLEFEQNPKVALLTRPERITGLFLLEKIGTQAPPLDWGIDGFDFWCPPRRPGGYLLAFSLSSTPENTQLWGGENVHNGYQRPWILPNAWVASVDDPCPWIEIEFTTTFPMKRIEIIFDTDYNHPMETVNRGHPERTMPMTPKKFRLVDDKNREVARISEWHQSRFELVLPEPRECSRLRLELDEMNGDSPGSVFDLRVYSE